MNRFTGFVDILVTPTGAVVPSYIYSTPTSFSMSSSYYHFWLAQRSDVQPPDPSATSAPCLPLPATVGASVYPGGGSIKGEYRLVTLFSRTGHVNTTEEPRFDSVANIATGTFNVNVPFIATQQGRQTA